MELDYTIIGKRLKDARVAKKLTQEALAEQIDVSVAFLSRLESGKSHISLRRLSQICWLLGILEGDILNGSSTNSSIYLKQEFSELLENSTPIQQKLIYNVATSIINTES